MKRNLRVVSEKSALLARPPVYGDSTNTPNNDTVLVNVLDSYDAKVLSPEASDALFLDEQYVIDNIYDKNLSRNFFEMISKEYNSPVIKNGYSCNCTDNNVSGKFNEGVVCPKCLAACSPQAKERLVFVKAPDKDLPFVNPSVLKLIDGTHIRHALLYIVKRRSKVWSPIKARKLKSYKTNPNLNFLKTVEAVFPHVELDYKFFLKEFERLMQLAILACGKKKATLKDKAVFQLLLNTYREDRSKIFPQHIYLPPSMFMTIRKMGKQKKAFKTISIASSITNTFISITSINHHEPVPELMDTLPPSISFDLFSQMSIIDAEVINKKKGIVRHSIDGGRRPYTLYAVLTQTVGHRHTFNDVYLPWSPMVNILREVIIHDMLKKGYTYEQADIKWFIGLTQYDEDINETFDRLEDEKYTVTIQRPPLLLVSSLITLDMHIKRNPKIKTLSIAPILFGTMNADSDGDNLLVEVHMSQDLADAAEQYRIANGSIIGDTVGSTFGKTGISKTVNHNISIMSRMERTNK